MHASIIWCLKTHINIKNHINTFDTQWNEIRKCFRYQTIQCSCCCGNIHKEQVTMFTNNFNVAAVGLIAIGDNRE